MPIQATGLVKSFGEPATRVLKGISLEIADGELVALTGRSGSGKSTLLYLLGALDQPTSGTVSIDGRDLGRASSRELHALRNREAGFVFQFHHLLPELSALENVLMPAMKAGELEARRPEALRLLAEFGLADKADRFPSQLSGGEQQRVAIARALVMSPRYVFADEPTGNLDSANGDIVMRLLKRINRERGTTIVYVTHDAGYAAQAGRIIRLVDGTVAAN